MTRAFLAAVASVAIAAATPVLAQTSGPDIAPASGTAPVTPDASGTTPTPGVAPGGNEAASSAGDAARSANSAPPIGASEQEPADPEDETDAAAVPDAPVPTTAPAQQK